MCSAWLQVVYIVFFYLNHSLISFIKSNVFCSLAHGEEKLYALGNLRLTAVTG